MVINPLDTTKYRKAWLKGVPFPVLTVKSKGPCLLFVLEWFRQGIELDPLPFSWKRVQNRWKIEIFYIEIEQMGMICSNDILFT